MSQNSDWARRRASIDQELGGHTDAVADIRIVQWDAMRGSRERAPVARHISTIAAGAAGHNVGIKIDAIDGSAESSRNVAVWLHGINLSGACSVFLANRSAVTLQAENEITPGWRDPDSEVRPRLFEIDLLTADIPAAAGAGIPMVCGVLPGNNLARENLPGFLPGVFMFENTNQQSLFFVLNAAATILHYTIQWQAIRI